MKNFPLASSAAGDVAQYNCVNAPYEAGYNSVRRYIVSLAQSKKETEKHTMMAYCHLGMWRWRSVSRFPGLTLVDTILSPCRRASSRATTTLPYRPRPPSSQQQEEKGTLLTPTSLLLLYKFHGSYFLLFGPSVIASKSISFVR